MSELNDQSGASVVVLYTSALVLNIVSARNARKSINIWSEKY